jgi:hypothetical protein
MLGSLRRIFAEDPAEAGRSWRKSVQIRKRAQLIQRKSPVPLSLGSSGSTAAQDDLKDDSYPLFEPPKLQNLSAVRTPSANLTPSSNTRAIEKSTGAPCRLLYGVGAISGRKPKWNQTPT